MHAYASVRYLVISDLVGNLPSLNWIIVQFAGNSFRIGVDLFLMLSGALSLGREWTIKSFLSKRLPRIILPFLFWGFSLGVFFMLLCSVSSFNLISSFDPLSILQYFYDIFMANKGITIAYWFFWMILGTYLIMPIFNKWVLHSSLDELEYFLVFWLITCLFDFTLGIDFPIKLSYFTSPIGLVVLGYYLRYTDRKILNNQYFALGLVVVSAALMVILSAIYSTDSHFYNFNRYSILNSLEVIGVFLLFKNFDKFNLNFKSFSNPDGLFKKSVSILARYSYGIYLVHASVIYVLVHFLKRSPPQPVLYLIILFGASLVISVIIMAVLNRIPYVNQVIGAK